MYSVCVSNKLNAVKWLLHSPHNWLIGIISYSLYIIYLKSSSLESSVFYIQSLCSLASFSGSTIQRDSVEGEIRGCDSEFSESSPCRNLAEDRICS
jgi:hypothetical protein